MSSRLEKQVVIIGAGPAGLTAAYELAQRHIHPIVLEKLDKVGGIARTENYKGYFFDMGGHRFFTKVEAVNHFWSEILGEDFLQRPRLSRIYYDNKFFNYPLKPLNALAGMGLFEGLLVVLSYFRWQLLPYRQEETFEQWVTNRFGRRLFETFFQSYTEKVWGIPCSQLKAEWAAQRIQDLSLKTAVLSMFVNPKNTIKTLIEEFHYPRHGPGMLWTAVKERIEEHGGVVYLNSNVISINREGNIIKSVVVSHGEGEETIEATDFISSMPVTQFLKRLNPPAPTRVLEAAGKLNYRDFLTVGLIVNKKDLFPDNWIYIHDPNVKVGRVQNFKNWSQAMVPDPAKTSLGLEYFCNEGDEIWTMADEDLIELGKREIVQIGLANYEDIEDGCVFRVEKSYPVYDSDYAGYLAIIKKYVATLKNCQSVGRNGLHRYNNQDHAMLTGMLAVRNLLNGESNDLWQINGEQVYLEEIRINDECVKTDDVVGAVQEALAHVFLKLDPTAFGISVGSVSGLLLLLTTLGLVWRGDETVTSYWQLLNQFFPGYSVSAGGSLLGLIYGFVVGFIIGWGFAFLRNVITAFYLASFYRSAERSVLSTFLEHI